MDTQIFGIKFHFEMKCIQTYILLFLSLIFICLSKKSHVQFTYFELFTDPIEMLELFTDLFVLVDNIDSAGLITPVRLVWGLRWKRWQWLQYDCKYDENYDHLWEVGVHGSSDDDIVEPVPVDVVHCHWVAKVGPHLGSNCFSHHRVFVINHRFFTVIIALSKSFVGPFRLDLVIYTRICMTTYNVRWPPLSTQFCSDLMVLQKTKLDFDDFWPFAPKTYIWKPS